MKKLLLIAIFLQTSTFAQTMRITDSGHEIEFTAPDNKTVMVNGETLTFSHYKPSGDWNERHYSNGRSSAVFYVKNMFYKSPRRVFAVFKLSTGRQAHGFMKIDK